MSAPEPSGGSAVASTTRLFLGQVLAVAAIATVLTAIGVAVKGNDTTRTQSEGPVATASPAEPSDDGNAAAPEPTEATDDATAPGDSPSDSTSSQAPASPSSSPPESPAPASTPAEERPFVDVLNQSAGEGAAAAVAAQAELTGWRIGRVDNFNGNVRTTTIYYFPGMKKHARALRKDLPGGQRLLEAFSTLVEGRLSVVLVEPPPAR